MYRGTEAHERARASGNDFNERCDQRQIIDCDVVNIFSIAGELAHHATSNDGVARFDRSRRSHMRYRVSWYLAIVAWCALVGSAAALPLVDDGSQTTIVAADSLIAGALIGFVGWRVSTWATAILTRVARTPDASDSR
jgi:hypothetical protein